MVKYSRVREQHVAVFGEAGSGKTVLLSSFFGPTQSVPIRTSFGISSRTTQVSVSDPQKGKTSKEADVAGDDALGRTQQRLHRV